jgi:hypothetical protein
MVGAMGDTQIPMSIPLDSDGFMRRECPSCERELKWRPTPDGQEAIPVPDGGYFCPYCGVQAPGDQWWTKRQRDAAIAKVKNKVVKPMLDDFGQSLQRLSSDHLRITTHPTATVPEPPLSESDDMHRVDFACHPSEPVKVAEAWDEPVHCLICDRADGAS